MAYAKMELGLLEMEGLNDGCQLALEIDGSIKMVLSPHYKNNSTGNVKIGGYRNDDKKAIIDITDAVDTGYVMIYLEYLERDDYDQGCQCRHCMMYG